MRRNLRLAWLVTLGVSLIVLAAVPLAVIRAHSQGLGPVESVGSRIVATRPAIATPSYGAAALGLRRADEEQPVATPTRLQVPGIGIDALILPVGLDQARAVAIPSDIRNVGWYELGVPPGAFRGSAVLVGHRDGRVQGHGVFYDLGLLDMGDPISVTDASGRTLTYAVVARESIAKKGMPYQELFAIDGPPRLTLISCGGYYDAKNGGYQDNVVVTAVRDYAIRGSQSGR